MLDYLKKILICITALAEKLDTLFNRDDEPFDPSWMNAEKWRLTRQ